MSARAAIVVTGTEVLAGVITDANGPWLGGELRRLGLEVRSITVVGDSPSGIRAELERLRDSEIDLIVTTGGLGPTEDDLTLAVVADVQGRPLVHDPALEGRVSERLAGALRRWPDLDADALARSARKQSFVPEGAVVLEPIGTAPGAVVAPAHGPGPIVAVLPGPPSELRTMWRDALALGLLDGVLAGRIVPRRRILRLVGIPESEIVKAMRAARDAGVELDELEITTCMRRGEIEVDTSFAPEAQATYERFEAVVRDQLEDKIFSDDGATLDDIVAGLLREQELTVAVAESLTGGLLASRLTDADGSSEYMLGGVVAYAVGTKVGVVGLDRDLIEREGVVSVAVAEALAAGAIELFGASVGLGITGEAGPISGSGRPVGTVCLAVSALDGRAESAELAIPGGRADVRDRSTTYALHALRRVLQARA